MLIKDIVLEDQVLRFNETVPKRDIMAHIASVKQNGASKPTGYDWSQAYYNVLRVANYQGGDSTSRGTPEYQTLSKNWKIYFVRKDVDIKNLERNIKYIPFYLFFKLQSQEFIELNEIFNLKTANNFNN